MAAALPLTLPDTQLCISVSSVKPAADTFVLIVRQHGVLGASLLAEAWKRDQAQQEAIEAAIAGAVQPLRTTTEYDIAQARREPTPIPPEVSGGPLDDLRVDLDALSDDPDTLARANLVAFERAANNTKGFADDLGTALTTYRLHGLNALEDAVIHFAARHVAELVYSGDSVSDVVGDLPCLLAGEHDIMAERQRQVIRRLLAPRKGERFPGIDSEVRVALALAVLADERQAGDRSAGRTAATIAELVETAAPLARLIDGHGATETFVNHMAGATPRTIPVGEVEESPPTLDQDEEEGAETEDEGHTI